MPVDRSKFIPRIVVAGTSGDSGKTLVSVGLLAGLRQLGYVTCAFKKGPDFIDPAWLMAASGSKVRNLDTFLVDSQKVRTSFITHSDSDAINLIEGNRGLYDGFDVDGSHSTAELARLLDAPVILVICATKTTRTLAAVALGMRQMDPQLNIAGVILNQVGGSRHRRIASEAIEKYAGLKVIGAVPRISGTSLLPARHLGLVTPAEYGTTSEITGEIGKLITDHVDLNRIVEIARRSPDLNFQERTSDRKTTETKVKIGYFSDSAFTFYYPENLELLQSLGAELVPISSLSSRKLPGISGLYIGGGFPETHADRLAKNHELKAEIKRGAENGLPIYAECGGLIYLCRSLKLKEKTYSMAGVFDIDLAMGEKPHGHGYSRMQADLDNEYYPGGIEIRGHEFHYTYPLSEQIGEKMVLSVSKGTGIAGGRDGLVKQNVFAAYLHVHADGEGSWASNLVRLASVYAHRNRNEGFSGGSQLFGRKAV
jgi:cobyrinic acid a,c-diamide synthase